MKKISMFILLISMIYPALAINQSIDQYVGNGNMAIEKSNQVIDNQIGNHATSYTTLVDQMHGFYRVYENSVTNNDTISKPVNYQNSTLYINKGDIVYWTNDAVPDTELTILSTKKLWSNLACGNYLCSDLRWNYKKFGYTFNRSGIYKIYIKQFPIFIQTVIVGPLSESPQVNTKKLSTDSSTNKNNSTENIINNIEPTPIYTTPVLNNNRNTTAENTFSFNFSIPAIKIQLSQRLDTFVLILILLSMIILSGKIKEENEEEIEIENH